MKKKSIGIISVMLLVFSVFAACAGEYQSEIMQVTNEEQEIAEADEEFAFSSAFFATFGSIDSLFYSSMHVARVEVVSERTELVNTWYIPENVGDAPEAYLANGFGQHLFDATTNYGLRYLECAETAAMGRALAAAGFNITRK